MIKYLDNRAIGFETVRSFESTMINRRISKLFISSHIKLERHFNTRGVSPCIQTLDIERIKERYLISGGSDGTICIYDLQNSTGKAAHTIKISRKRKCHKDGVQCVQWNPFGSDIFVSGGSKNLKLKIWDAKYMKLTQVIKTQADVYCLHMSPVATQHSLIAVGMDCPHVFLLDPKSGSYYQELRGHKLSIPCLRWSPTCEYLLATGGADSSIFLWDIRSAKHYLTALDQHNGEARDWKKVRAHNGDISSLRFTNEGRYLSSCGGEHRGDIFRPYQMRLWDVALGTNMLVDYDPVMLNRNICKPFRYGKLPIEICCNSNPPILFVCCYDYIRMYDLISGKQLNSLYCDPTTHGLLPHPVDCIVYRSTTNQLIGGKETHILLWTPDTEQEDEETLYKQMLNFPVLH